MGGASPLRRYQRANEDFDETIRIDPQYSDAFYMRGLVSANLGQIQHALVNYDWMQALETETSLKLRLGILNPSNLGGAYHTLGQIGRGTED